MHICWKFQTHSTNKPTVIAFWSKILVKKFCNFDPQNLLRNQIDYFLIYVQPKTNVWKIISSVFHFLKMFWKSCRLHSLRTHIFRCNPQNLLFLWKKICLNHLIPHHKQLCEVSSSLLKVTHNCGKNSEMMKLHKFF